MKRLLKYPATNAICLCIFSLFYAALFLFGEGVTAWQRGLAIALLALTAIVALLLAGRKPFDEYHTTLLLACLAIGLVLTMVALAILYLIVLAGTSDVRNAFTIFIAIHWGTVVLLDLVFVLLCRWR